MTDNPRSAPKYPIQESFECACHSECIVAACWPEAFAGVELAFWRMGQNRKMTLRWRLRTALRSLRRGDPYEDFILLDNEAARRLGLYLVEHAFPRDNGNIGETTVTKIVVQNDATAGGSADV